MSNIACSIMRYLAIKPITSSVLATKPQQLKKCTVYQRIIHQPNYISAANLYFLRSCNNDSSVCRLHLSVCIIQFKLLQLIQL